MRSPAYTYIFAIASFFTALPGSVYAGSITIGLPAVGGTGPGTSPASFINYLVIFSFVFVSAAAIIALVVGGIAYLTSAGNPGRESDAKDRIQSALLGALIVFAAIAVLYTINPDFVRLRNPGIPLVKLPDVIAVQPRIAGSCTLLGAGWDISQSCQNETTRNYDLAVMAVRAQDCTGWGIALNITDAGGATIDTKIATFDSDYLTVSWQPQKVGTYRFTAIAGSGNTLTQAGSGQLAVINPPCITITSGDRCGDPSDVCRVGTGTLACPGLATTQWSRLIPEVAAAYPIGGSVNTEKFLETIMRIESAGRLDPGVSKYGACGLMQFIPDTAKIYGPSCGKDFSVMTKDQICEWLRGGQLSSGETQETVARTSICMTSMMVGATLRGSCYRGDGQMRDLAAGYNGGQGCDPTQGPDNALALSRSCTDTDCSERPTRRYECLWDDPAHTKCDMDDGKGFRETRNYVQKFNACRALLGS